jgi:hypothetical protein
VLAPIMLFYIYRIDRKLYGHKMVKGTCLAAPQRKIGTPRKLGLESPQRTAPTHHFLTRRKHNQSINSTNMYIMNRKCEREGDSENVGARITRIGVVVETIWLKEFLGARLEFWKSFRGISVNIECLEGFGVKI